MHGSIDVGKVFNSRVYVLYRARTNVRIFECLFIYVTFISKIFAPEHSLIVFIPDLCANFMQKCTLL